MASPVSLNSDINSGTRRSLLPKDQQSIASKVDGGHVDYQSNEERRRAQSSGVPGTVGTFDDPEDDSLWNSSAPVWGSPPLGGAGPQDYFALLSLVFLNDDPGESVRLRALSLSEGSQGTGVASTFFILLKAFVGTGVLFLPRAFYQGGIVFSPIVMGIVAIFCTYSIALLVKAKSALRVSAYEDIGRVYGAWLQNLIRIGIVVVQFGVAAAYVVFVAQNFKTAVSTLTDDADWITSLSNMAIAGLSIVLYIPLVLVRNLKFFAIPSLVADVFIMSGIAYTLVVCIKTTPKESVEAFNPTLFPLFVATATFSFEGVQLCLPIEEAMKEPNRFLPILLTVCTLVAVILISFGMFGFWAFGENTQDIILLNLPNNTPTALVQLSYTGSIYLSIPIVFFPAIRIIQDTLGFTHRTGCRVHFLRGAVMVFLGGLGVLAADHLNLMVAVLSSISGVPLAMVYPPLLHARIFPQSRVRYLNYVLAAFGVMLTVFCFVMSLKAMIEELTK